MADAVERMLDQPMLWWQAVGLFVDHFSLWELSWQESIGDYARERKCVHALRSAAANVGAIALSRVAADLENQLLICLSGKEALVPEHLRRHVLDTFRQTLHVAAEAWHSGSDCAAGRA